MITRFNNKDLKKVEHFLNTSQRGSYPLNKFTNLLFKKL